MHELTKWMLSNPSRLNRVDIGLTKWSVAFCPDDQNLAAFGSLDWY